MDLYSRTVAILKVLFPLLALAILATLFLLSRSIDPTATIPFAEGDMEDRMRDQRVTAPFFSGTTPQGDEITVKASVATPAIGDRPAGAKDLSARIILADGGRITLTSDAGSFDLVDDMASFRGNVRIASTSGYVVNSDELNVSLIAIAGNTPGTVDGSGPIGTFTAGQMEFSAKNGDGPVHMLFKNGVKLIYDPKQQER